MKLKEALMSAAFVVLTDPGNGPRYYRVDVYDPDTDVLHYHDDETGDEMSSSSVELAEDPELVLLELTRIQIDK